ncbi:MAG TPA: acyl-CoA thioesterase domain-containing protein [Acidimicrobiales bacterium]|nr:acyl-CoA thioesterase domain-containing protein [Acidimicrobiales bacterium]
MDVDFATMMALEPYGDDTWIGVGPRYPWGGLFGGQIVAQALRAAIATVDGSYLPHSLHASFLRSGSHTEKILFEVERVRDGRSFCNRRVVARQAVGVILTMTASFHVDEGGATVQTVTRPPLPHPDEMSDSAWTPVFDRRMTLGPVPGSVAAWMRMAQPIGEDPALHSCALAYMSDDLPTDTVVALHPERDRGEEFHDSFFTASVDHALWFHRPMRADEWHLQAFECHGLAGSRGVAIGHVFAGDGTHTATVGQEVVLRQRQ